MADEEKAQTPAGLATDILKMVSEALHLKSESSEKPTARSGPLLLIGRFYISLTLILAAATSAGAYMDSKTAAGPAFSVEVMRLVVTACVAAGLLMGAALIFALFWRNTLYLFSPAELSVAAQESLLSPKSKESKEATEKVQPGPPPVAPQAKTEEPPKKAAA